MDPAPPIEYITLDDAAERFGLDAEAIGALQVKLADAPVTPAKRGKPARYRLVDVVGAMLGELSPAPTLGKFSPSTDLARCGHCKRTYIDQASLDRHIARDHADVVPSLVSVVDDPITSPRSKWRSYPQPAQRREVNSA